MTGWRKRQVMEMAREAQLPYFYQTGETANLLQLEAFEALVRSDEREACAMLCEDLYRAWGKSDENVQCPDPIHCADAIRNRGNKHD